MIKKIRYFLEYAGLRTMVFFFNMLTEKQIGYVASFLGILWYYVDPKHRDIAKRNISYAFPEMNEKIRNMILKEGYKNIIEAFITFPRISRFNASNINNLFEFQCEEYYREAVNRGKGVFILTGHLGNWEFAAAAQSLRNGGLIAVAKDIHNPYIDRYIKSLRRSAGIEVVRPRNAVFKLLRSLKQGKTIAMLLDQNTLRHEAVFVNFFGRPAATQYAMALMALKTGAAVVPGYIMKNHVRGGYIIRYEKPIFVDDVKDREKAVIELTQQFTTILETHIKRAPGQWFWVHNRFKTTPSS
ncbi:MAG: lysophospholipid acyltransferase family protein [bacterium]